MQAIGDPATPMIKALPACGIGPAQEGAAHAAIDEVIPARDLQRG
jgi:hypothetical protein